MKKKTYDPGISRTAIIYLRKLITIYRTRNVYGDNSMCVRIGRLFSEERRHGAAGSTRIGLQY